MPFKSEAQRKLFWAKSERGEIPKKTVLEWEHATKNKKALPEHVAKKAYVEGAAAARAKLGFLESVDPEDLPKPLRAHKKRHLDDMYRLNAASGLPSGGSSSEAVP